MLTFNAKSALRASVASYWQSHSQSQLQFRSFNQHRQYFIRLTYCTCPSASSHTPATQRITASRPLSGEQLRLMYWRRDKQGACLVVSSYLQLFHPSKVKPVHHLLYCSVTVLCRRLTTTFSATVTCRLKTFTFAEQMETQQRIRSIWPANYTSRIPSISLSCIRLTESTLARTLNSVVI